MYGSSIGSFFGNVKFWDMDVCLVAGGVGKVGVVWLFGIGFERGRGVNFVGFRGALFEVV